MPLSAAAALLRPPARFCAAPWVEGVLRENGALLPCCRNLNALGDWQREGLAAAWNGEAYRAFRAAIAAGRFPDDQCRACYAQGTARSLESELIGPLIRNRELARRLAGDPLPGLDGFETLLRLPSETAEARTRLSAFLRALEDCAAACARAGYWPAPLRLALRKLAVIGAVVECYWAGDPAPAVIAPFRQVGLQAQCNARCIQCIFRYSGELQTGAPLDPLWIPEAFSGAENLLDFFMFGSEFLFYPGWEGIADLLVGQGVPFGISTNGIALTPEVIRRLIDRQIIHSLNLSLDGATRRTVERIRLGVRFDEVMKSVEFLFDHANERRHVFAMNFSFILMRRNYREFPDFIRGIGARLRGRPFPVVYAVGTNLVPYPDERYRRFYEREHLSTLPDAELAAMFREAQAASRETGVNVNLFSSHTLEDFLAAGGPLPTADHRTRRLYEPEAVPV